MRSDSIRGLFLGILLVIGASSAFSGCAQPGASQRAGEKIDSVADKVSDTINPKGPAEKAGRSIDRATGN